MLDAFLQGTQEFSSDPQGLAKNRAAAGGCFPTQAEYTTAYQQANPGAAAAGTQQGGGGAGGAGISVPGQLPPQPITAYFQTTSNYFRLTSHVTLGSSEFLIYSLLYQDDTQGTVRPILRTYTPD